MYKDFFNLGCREALEIIMNHSDTFQGLVKKKICTAYPWYQEDPQHCIPMVSGRPTGETVGMQGAASQKWEHSYTYGPAMSSHKESNTLWLTMV